MVEPKDVVAGFTGKTRKKQAADFEVNQDRIDTVLKSELGDDVSIQTAGEYDMDRKQVTLSVEVTFPEELKTTDEFVRKVKQLADIIFGEGNSVVINQPSFQYFSIEKTFNGGE